MSMFRRQEYYAIGDKKFVSVAAEDIRGAAHSVKSKQHVARTLGKWMTNAMRCSGLPGNSNCLRSAGFITEILCKSQTVV